MKRLTIYVLTSLLTFSAGVAGERLLNTKTPVKSTPPPRIEQLQTVPIWLPPTETFTAAPPVPQPPEPTLFIDYPRKKFDPSATYVPIGLKHKGLSEFSAFWIDAYVTEGKGYIQVGTRQNEDYQELEVKFALATQRRLIFVTDSTEDGIEYRFEGEFLRGNMIADAPEGKPVLKGTLTKTKNGRKVAEAVVKFGIEIHEC
jgi:hypothetical protein